MNEWSFFCSKWLNPRWQNSRCLTSSWVRMNEFESDWISFSQRFVQNGWIQDGRIQDDCHHRIKQIELVWVRVRVEWECFWVNLREENKVFESKMAEFKMAATIKLSQNEWVKFFLCKMAESKMVEFKMSANIKLSQNEWVKFFLFKMVESKRQNSRWLTLSNRVRMNEFESDWISLGQSFVQNG